MNHHEARVQAAVLDEEGRKVTGKRRVDQPLDAPLGSAFVEWRQRGSVLGSVDLSRRFGVDNAFGLRLNAAAEHIDPPEADVYSHLGDTFEKLGDAAQALANWQKAAALDPADKKLAEKISAAKRQPATPAPTPGAH